MIADLFKALVLGACCTILVLIVQAPFANISTLSSIVLLTIIEELARFTVLFFAFSRKAFVSPAPIFLGIFFGIGFAGVESLLLVSPHPLHIVLLFLIHVILSVSISLCVSQKRIPFAIFGLSIALALHLAYNITLFLSL